MNWTLKKAAVLQQAEATFKGVLGCLLAESFEESCCCQKFADVPLLCDASFMEASL